MSASKASNSPYVIELKDVEKSFKDTGSKTLSGINLRLNPGEFVFLTGASGSGKTTLLRMIMGLTKPSKGEVTVLGRAVHRLGDSARRELRRNIGVILQDHRLLSVLNVYENIELPLIWIGLASAQRRKRLSE